MAILTNAAAAKENKIPLATRRGIDIPNSQALEVSFSDAEFSKDFRKKFEPVCIFRTNPISVFNCLGLTFASRRTGIYEIEYLELILNDDEYQEVADEKVLPGDVILYFEFDGGSVIHVGFVISEPDTQLGIPRIWSKWGKGPEVIHPAICCPYIPATLKYYRITK